MSRYGMGWLALALFAAPLGAQAQGPIRALIITGDDVGVHDWKATTAALKTILGADGAVDVAVTETPARDLTPENLSKYDVLILNYRETNPTPATKWTEANREAFLGAIRGGKGLLVQHFGSSSFVKPNSVEFERAVAGGWRSQGFHGPAHAFTVKSTPESAHHPIGRGLPKEFAHPVDELYSNSLITPGSVVLATAYCDPAKPKGTGKDEPVIWAGTYGKGRVVEDVLGHDVPSLTDPALAPWIRRSVAWAAGRLD